MLEPEDQYETDDEQADELGYDSDSDTIPYENSDAEETANPRTTRSGRTIRDHQPVDYQDL